MRTAHARASLGRLGDVGIASRMRDTPLPKPLRGFELIEMLRASLRPSGDY